MIDRNPVGTFPELEIRLGKQVPCCHRIAEIPSCKIVDVDTADAEVCRCVIWSKPRYAGISVAAGKRSKKKIGTKMPGVLRPSGSSSASGVYISDHGYKNDPRSCRKCIAGCPAGGWQSGLDVPAVARARRQRGLRDLDLAARSRCRQGGSGSGQPLLRIQTHPRDEEPPETQPDDPILRIAAQKPLLLTFRQSRTELI